MEDNSKSLQNTSFWDCGSPLYDSYELVSIFHQLDRGLATLYPSFAPPPDRHSSHTSWISSRAQKLKRVSCKCIPRFRISSSENGCEERERLNKNYPVSWLSRFQRIASQSKTNYMVECSCCRMPGSRSDSRRCL